MRESSSASSRSPGSNEGGTGIKLESPMDVAGAARLRSSKVGVWPIPVNGTLVPISPLSYQRLAIGSQVEPVGEGLAPPGPCVLAEPSRTLKGVARSE